MAGRTEQAFTKLGQEAKVYVGKDLRFSCSGEESESADPACFCPTFSVPCRLHVGRKYLELVGLLFLFPVSSDTGLLSVDY